MRVYFIGFIVFFIYPILVSSQAIVTLTAGYSYADYFDNANYDEFNHYGDPYMASYNSKAGVTINFASKFRTGKKWNLGNSLTYVYKVVNFKSQSTGIGGQYNQDANYQLNYLYYSIFPEFSYGEKVKINCAIGFSAGLLFYSYVKGNFFNILGGTVKDPYREGNANSLFHFYDTRFLLNVGLEIPLKHRVNLIIENRFSLPLTKITAGKFGEGLVSINSKDFSLSVGIGWLIVPDDGDEQVE